jgi:hypothetical protein
VKIVEPPGVPITITALLSCKSMVGDMDESMRLPGCISLAVLPTTPKILATPGLTLKSSISLFNKNPAPSTTTPEPYAQLMV